MPWVDINYACSVVEQMYPSDKWRSRVRGMSDGQVLAIYYKYKEVLDRLKAKKAYSVPKEKEAMVDAVKEPERNSFNPDYGEQLSLGAVL